MSDHDQVLRDARAAHARGQWAAARAAFTAVGPDRLHVDDLAAWVDAAWWLGRVDERLELGARLHRRQLDAGDGPGAAMTAIELGFDHLLRGQEAVGSGWLSRARRLLADDPDRRESGYLLVVDANVALDAGELDEAATTGRRMRELGTAHDDVTLQALGLFLEGVVEVRRGRVARGVAVLDEAMLPVVAGEVTPEWAGNLYCQMMAVCHELADLQRARQWTEATRRWCDGFEDAVMFTGICRVHRVQLLQAQGAWEQAERQAHAACEALADLNVAVTAEAHYQLGELHRLRDRADEAEDAYGRARALGRDPQPGLALLDLRRGRGEVAAAALTTALAAAGDDAMARAPLLAACAEVALARGDLSRAGTAVDELAEVATTHHSPGWHAAARQWQGAVLLARDRPADALPLVQEARRCWQDLEVPHEVARVRCDVARASTALGDHDGADRELAAAEEVFDRLGATADLRRVRALRGTRPGRAGLTPREQQVLEVVATGCTNAEAARQLHISDRTVARHLANVYLKTATNSRTAAVHWARERGLV